MDNKEHRIKFHYLTGPFYFPARLRLKAFLLELLTREGKGVEAINYIFCNDEYLLQVNQQYLGHDDYTDIITFELSPKGQPLLSDVFISLDRVRENAQRFQTSFSREIHRVIFHGALHLTGLKDKSETQAKLMRNKEEEYLQRYFVSRETKRLED